MGTREAALKNLQIPHSRKGKKNKKTLERELVLAGFKQRVMQTVDHLFDSQLTLARGLSFLYKIEKEFVSTGGVAKNGDKKGFWRPKKPVLVTSQAEIEEYLEGIVQ